MSLLRINEGKRDSKVFSEFNTSLSHFSIHDKKSLSYWIIKAYRTITAQMQEYDSRPLLPTGSPIAALNNGSNAEDKVTFRVKKVYHSLIEF